MLENLVLGLSDQQLLTGLLIEACALAKYDNDTSRVNHSMHNLFIAADLAYFSSVTHATTLVTLLPFFRGHRKLSNARMILVYATFAMWFYSNVEGLQRYPAGAKDFKNPLFSFNFLVQIAEVFGLVSLYVTICISMYVSDRALETRKALSGGSDHDIPVILAWVEIHHATFQCTPVSIRIRNPLTCFAVWFCDLYLRAKPLGRKFLWVVAEFLFPWYTTSILLGILWTLGVYLLGYDLSKWGSVQSWGFGQLLPMFLVVLPFLTLAESYAGAFDYPANLQKLTDSSGASKSVEALRPEPQALEHEGIPMQTLRRRHPTSGGTTSSIQRASTLPAQLSSETSVTLLSTSDPGP